MHKNAHEMGKAWNQGYKLVMGCIIADKCSVEWCAMCVEGKQKLLSNVDYQSQRKFF